MLQWRLIRSRARDLMSLKRTSAPLPLLKQLEWNTAAFPPNLLSKISSEFCNTTVHTPQLLTFLRHIVGIIEREKFKAEDFASNIHRNQWHDEAMTTVPINWWHHKLLKIYLILKVFWDTIQTSAVRSKCVATPKEQTLWNMFFFWGRGIRTPLHTHLQNVHRISSHCRDSIFPKKIYGGACPRPPDWWPSHLNDMHIYGQQILHSHVTDPHSKPVKKDANPCTHLLLLHCCWQPLTNRLQPCWLTIGSHCNGKMTMCTEELNK